MSQIFELPKNNWDSHIAGDRGTHISLTGEDFGEDDLDRVYQALTANGVKVVDGAVIRTIEGSSGELAVDRVDEETIRILSGLGYIGTDHLRAA